MSDETNARQKNLVLQISAIALGNLMRDLRDDFDDEWPEKGSAKVSKTIDFVIAASEELVAKIDKKYPDEETQAKFLREQVEAAEREKNELLNKAELKRKEAEKALSALKEKQTKKKLTTLPAKEPEKATDDASIRFGLLELK